MRIYQVDAFTDRRFAGNPAAVCLLDRPADEGWMRQVAREMNLSETAFVNQEGEALRLRWFTPTVEVDLCGHATLASAHILWETGALPAGGTARFMTRSGALAARRAGDWIEMDFPAEPAALSVPPAGLAEALGVGFVWCGRSRLDWLVEIASEAELRGLAPDFKALAALQPAGEVARGAIVTTRSASAGVDFVSRYFAPAAGIDEDPVTGSTHCTLGPFWGERFGKRDLVGFQASARGGIVKVRLGGERVILSGQAVTVLRGELV
jgi:predicted PhzF superfamily epimerase YddE/YHI9